MRAHHAVSKDSFTLTPDGARLADDLRVGDAVMALGRDGDLAEREITSLSDAPEQAGWRVLTSVGDIVVPEGATLVTRQGPAGVSSIVSRVRAGDGVTLEVLSPLDVPRPSARRTTRRDIQESLCALDPPAVRIPAPLADDTAICADVESLLERAGVAFDRHADDRWVAYTFAPPDPSDGAARGLGAQADVLLTLTAWEVSDEGLVSRTLLQDVGLRRRILAGLACLGTPFEVSWVPGYRPVEARIRRLDPDRRTSFAKVRGAIPASGACTRVQLSRPGSLVVGLALQSGGAGAPHEAASTPG